MEILFIAPQPFYSVRGTPIALLRMLHCLQASGHQMDLVTYPIGVDVNLAGLKVVRAWRVPFIRSVPIGASLRKIVLDFFLFWTALFQLMKKRYDVIHAVEEGAFLAAPLAKAFRLSLIYDMDSNISDQLANHRFFKFPLFLSLTRRLEKKTARNSIAVVTVCQDLTEKAVSLGADPRKVFQIDDIPLNEECAPLSEKERERLRQAINLNGEKLIVYSGNFEKYQGIELLLQSAAQLVKWKNNFKLVLFGGEADQVEALKHVAASLGVGRYVYFAGKKKIEEVNAYLELADVLVSPRIQGTNVPLKIYTYMKSGKPIVATRLKMHTQVLDDSDAVLTTPDSEGYAAGLRQVLEDPALARRLGNQARQVAEEKYSLEQFDQRTRSLYAFVGKAVGEKGGNR